MSEYDLNEKENKGIIEKLEDELDKLRKIEASLKSEHKDLNPEQEL